MALRLEAEKIGISIEVASALDRLDPLVKDLQFTSRSLVATTRFVMLEHNGAEVTEMGEHSPWTTGTDEGSPGGPSFGDLIPRGSIPSCVSYPREPFAPTQ